MNRTRTLYHMVRADFLERVRRYSFLLTVGFSVYLGYAVYAGQVTLQLDNYRGVNNSAWLGSVVALVATIWITLVGFYIVKNAIERDRQTRVGQILATTPMSKSFYTLSKMLSNFAVLAVMVLILAAAALAIQLSHYADSRIDLAALLSPILILGLSAVAVTAGLAVLFESLPVLRGGVGNVLYFFLWIALLTASVFTVEGNRAAPSMETQFRDYSGIASIMVQMQAQLHQLDPSYKGGAVFTIGNNHPATATFLWTGVKWTGTLLLGRALWVGVAVGLALLAALFFDRFNTARNGLRAAKSKEQAEAVDPQDSAEPAAARRSAVTLTPLSRTGSHTRFLALVAAELRLLVRGHGWWWYAGAAGLFIACLVSPMEPARSGILAVAWIWPVLVWSQMGTREAQWATGPIIFSAYRAVPRQLAATYAAGVLVTALAGGGMALHLLYAADFAGLAAWAAGALFIPAMALALGVCSGSRKAFEALYTAWWYLGPLHHIRLLDFMGTTPQSSTPVVFVAAAALLVAIAYSWRKVRLAYA